MRLGGEVFVDSEDPEVVAKAHREAGYRAASAPWGLRLAETERIKAIREAYKKHDVLLAWVGVWGKNLMDPDEEKRKANLEVMKEAMALADELGAGCALTIAGRLKPDNWDGPHARSLSQEAFDLAVANSREVIDSVKPRRAKLAYEMMPSCLPDSPDAYLRLIEAIDRPAFGVHLDVVNIINGVYRYFDTTAVIEECFEKLGPHVLACDLKDVKLRDGLTVHLDEVMVGEGNLDIRT
ncbi:MAG: sugar phosphate isomerase/epimerase, partial [Armatimonadetes bacterium]|nr:sugar phosphate isomerase/epimerase [Armatimonadota bacterium]